MVFIFLFLNCLTSHFGRVKVILNYMHTYTATFSYPVVDSNFNFFFTDSVQMSTVIDVSHCIICLFITNEIVGQDLQVLSL